MTRNKRARADAEKFRLEVCDKANEILEIKREKDAIAQRYLHYKAECVKLQATVEEHAQLLEEAVVAVVAQEVAYEAAADHAAADEDIAADDGAEAMDEAAADAAPAETTPAKVAPAEDVDNVMEQASVARRAPVLMLEYGAPLPRGDILELRERITQLE
jgi:hypothetical protein